MAVSNLRKSLGVKKEAYQRGRYYPSHFYRTIKQLEAQKKIRVIPERIPEKIKFEPFLVLAEEEPDELTSVLEKLHHPDASVRKYAAEEFKSLCRRTIVILSLRSLQIIKKTLVNKKYTEVWPLLLEGLSSVVVYARQRNVAEPIEQTLKDTLMKIASDSSAEFKARQLAIQVLREFETEEVVNFFFKMMAKSDPKTFEELKGVLARGIAELYSPRLTKVIRENMYKLLANKSTKERAEYVVGIFKEYNILL